MRRFLSRFIIPYQTVHEANLRRLSVLHSKLGNTQQPFTHNRITLLGSSNQVGIALLRKLLATNTSIFASKHRTDIPFSDPKLTWFQANLEEGPIQLPNPTDIVLSTVIISLLPRLIPGLAAQGVKHLIALSSASIIGKSTSPNKKEQALVESLLTAEEKLIQQCQQHGIHYTIFRPSMIYGLGLDQNITLMEAFIKRYGRVWLAGEGKGKRAPTHADDVATIMLQASEQSISHNKIYTLDGGEVLTMRDIIFRLFKRQHKRPRIYQWPSLPIWLDRLSFGLLTGESVLRFEKDLLFDDSQARSELGYEPRPFTLDY